MISRRGVLKGLLGVTLAGLGFGGYAAGIEPQRLRVQRWALQPEGWPRGKALRIVMLADIHAGVPHMSEVRVQEICDRAMAEAGDLIVLMGDYVARHMFLARHIPVSAIAPILAGLKAPLGVHAILGNHDWWDDPVAQARGGPGPVLIANDLRAAGLSVLVNQALRLDGFWLAGLDSQLAIERPKRKTPRGMHDIAGTLGQVTDDAPVILLAHEPDIFLRMPEAMAGRVAVQLSGHTHGGQVRFGPWVPMLQSRKRMPERLVYGPYQNGASHLVVSGGLGCSTLPVRFGVPPEITVVDLT